MITKFKLFESDYQFLGIMFPFIEDVNIKDIGSDCITNDYDIDTIKFEEK